MITTVDFYYGEVVSVTTVTDHVYEVSQINEEIFKNIEPPIWREEVIPILKKKMFKIIKKYMSLFLRPVAHRGLSRKERSVNKRKQRLHNSR